MDDLDFYTHVLTLGDVQGARLGSAPADWEKTLGKDYVDDTRKGRRRWDFGLVEVSYVKSSVSWSCTSISLQIHRLSTGTEEFVVPAQLRKVYGRFRPHVDLGAIHDRLIGQGSPIEPIDDDPTVSNWYRRLWLPQSRAIMYVVDGPDQGIPAEHRSGDIWAVVLSADADVWKQPMTGSTS